MTKHRDTPPTKSVVGYKKPPSSTQFKKGCSGNPKGRPKKLQGREIRPRKEDLQAVLNYAMTSEYTYTLNGEEQSLPFIVLLFRKMQQDALKGDRHARTFLLQNFQKNMDEQYKDKMEFLQLAREKDLISLWEAAEYYDKT